MKCKKNIKDVEELFFYYRIFIMVSIPNVWWCRWSCHYCIYIVHANALHWLIREIYEWNCVIWIMHAQLIYAFY
jgi:hypothetical protein